MRFLRRRTSHSLATAPRAAAQVTFSNQLPASSCRHKVITLRPETTTATALTGISTAHSAVFPGIASLCASCLRLAASRSNSSYPASANLSHAAGFWPSAALIAPQAGLTGRCASVTRQQPHARRPRIPVLLLLTRRPPAAPLAATRQRAASGFLSPVHLPLHLGEYEFPGVPEERREGECVLVWLAGGRAKAPACALVQTHPSPIS